MQSTQIDGLGKQRFRPHAQQGGTCCDMIMCATSSVLPPDPHSMYELEFTNTEMSTLASSIVIAILAPRAPIVG